MIVQIVQLSRCSCQNMSDSEKSPQKKERNFLGKIVHSFRKKFRDISEDDNEKSHVSPVECRNKKEVDTNNSQEASCSKQTETQTTLNQNKLFDSKNTIQKDIDNKSNIKIKTEIDNQRQTPLSTPKENRKSHYKKGVDIEDKDGRKTKKFIFREVKNIDDTSDDSDYSITDSDDLSDDNEHLLESEKAEYNLREDYFTKGKYMSYFFLQMEKMCYDPYEIYSIIQYYSLDNPRTPDEKGRNH